MKSHESDFADDGMGWKIMRCAGSIYAAGIACLGACEGWRDSEQSKKRHRYGSATAHLSLHLETN
jgi:hypothetical protein